MAETIKAKNRRLRENFFEKYIQGKGIDIGAGDDKIDSSAIIFDKESGDATFLKNIKDGSFDYVYSSHCLEHLGNPYLGLKNWFRVLKQFGYLILYVPHRDLYEKRKELPSKFNGDHKFFLLPDEEELPFTLSLKNLVVDSLEGNDFIFEYMKVCNEGFESNGEEHSGGEYSIELVVKKV